METIINQLLCQVWEAGIRKLEFVSASRSCKSDAPAQEFRDLWSTIGPKVVPFYGLYLESYRENSKRNYLGAYG